MQQIIIEKTVNFSQKLFYGQIFDEFLFLEGHIVTNCSFSLNGRLNKSFYTEEDYNSLEEPKLTTWQNIKPVYRQILADTDNLDKFPVKFSVILTLSPNQTKKLLAGSDSDIAFENIEGLHLNIKYENGILTCTTGTSLKIFTLDKSLENYFDKYTENFLNRF